MDKIQDILASKDISKIGFYIEYSEMLLEMFEKRGLDQEELIDERERLIIRFKELSRRGN